MSEHDALVLSYVHLASFPRAGEALHTLKKVASLVKPIMRARNWKVRELAEFFPDQANLLGLNVDRGRKICLRLRHPGDQNQFLPIESVIDTMLHELAHIVHGPHDSKFHALWDQLRDENQSLLLKGYTGEGFLSEGRRLGGSRMPPREARRLAREAAEKRRAQPGGQNVGGRRLGGSSPRPGEDLRRVIGDAVDRRNKTLKGCGTEKLSESQIHSLADTATQNGFRTQAEEDEANEAAIAQALWELVQEDDKVKYGSSYIPPNADNPTGNGGGTIMAGSRGGGLTLSERQSSLDFNQNGRAGQGDGSVYATRNEADGWVCGLCTLLNEPNFLCCDACGTERSPEMPQRKTDKSRSRSPERARQTATIDLTGSSPPRNPPKPGGLWKTSTPDPKPAVPQTWQCSFCGTRMERKWWTCSACGVMKDNSR